MAIDEGLAQRIRESLGSARVTERKMFGGIAFMSGTCSSASRSECSWCASVPSRTPTRRYSRTFARWTLLADRCYVYVDAVGTERDEDLSHWVQAGLAVVGTLPAK